MDLAAKQAREILENREQINTEMWYEKTKYYFFELIQYASLEGKNSITIDPVEWQDKRENRNYLEDRLKELGYTTEYSGYMHNYGMTISW